MTMSELDQFIREVFGDSVARLSQFQGDQMKKVVAKVQEIAREGVKDEIARLQSEITDLRSRVAMLEAERVEKAAEEV
jgi:gas vesicle protein